jgi:hypothetical protein
VTRYFKATDGQVTVFRQANAGKTGAGYFRWAHFRTDDLTHGPAPVGEISWSIGWREGAWPAEEIDAAAYKTLAVLKARRIRRDYGEHANVASRLTSWVRNAELEAVL